MCAWHLFIPQHYIPYELPFLINQQLDELSLKKKKKLADAVAIHFAPSPTVRPYSVMMELSQVMLKSLPVYLS